MQDAVRKIWQSEVVTIFVNGKQKQVLLPPEIDGLPVDEFIAGNADPIY